MVHQGVGKTALVNAARKRSDFTIIEMNASRYKVRKSC